MTRVAIVGSRPEDDEDRDYRREKAISEYISSLPIDTVIVSGCAPGADLWAELAARRLCMQLALFPAAWKRRDGTTNRSAGHRRNALIAEYADRCVAFYGSAPSPGTDSTVALFRKAGKPVEVIT